MSQEAQESKYKLGHDQLFKMFSLPPFINSFH
uniref:Uncharacterized protein n=1 Tax=Anguilla anguilla TaxID=7936 RepID=A0A0E9R3C5_ANGAN